MPRDKQQIVQVCSKWFLTGTKSGKIWQQPWGFPFAGIGLQLSCGAAWHMQLLESYALCMKEFQLRGPGQYVVWWVWVMPKYEQIVGEFVPSREYLQSR